MTERRAWGAAAVGLLGAAFGWLLAPGVFPQAWLSAMVLFSLWPLGSLGLLLAHALTGGRWGDALRPGLLLGLSTMPLLLPVAVPYVATLSPLYEWARPDGALLPNRFWLNLPFAGLRGVIYLVTWLGLGALAAGRAQAGRSLVGLACIGLPLLALTVSFAAIDSTMSLQPHFISSAYGMIAMTGAGVLALSCAVLVTDSLGTAEADQVGKLMLGLALLWIYLDFMQLLIVWQSDLVSQAPWYLRRARGGWGLVSGVVALMHGIIPVLALLFTPVRRSWRALRVLAWMVVTAEVLRTAWTVLPAVPRAPGLVDAACLLGVGGLAAAVALRRRAPAAVAQHA